MTDEIHYLQQIGKGSEEALNKIYAAYSVKIYNTVLSYTQNAEDAEELTQDVFFTVFKTAADFRFNSSLSTWIYRIAVNKSLDFLRKKKAEKRFAFFSSLYNKDSGRLESDPPDFNHPGILAENKENAARLFRAIDALPENQKTAFILSQVEGLSQKETAEIMKTGSKAVEGLLQRAKANLRTDLKKDFPERGIRK